MIYLKYSTFDGVAVGLHKQPDSFEVPSLEGFGFLPIQEELDPQEWAVDLGTLSLIPREVDPETANEQNMFLLRVMRDRKLTDCDWRVVADSPLSEAQRSEWVAYRQALRDLPSTIQGPLLSLDDVVWPVEP